MALDEALLDDAVQSGRAFLRLYRWDPPTLSIGRNQSPGAVASDGIPVVRRPTGGQAVWHEQEVTYAVAAPIAMFGSLREAYREIHTRVAQGLQTLGVVSALAPPVRMDKSSGRSPSCFAAAVGGEILTNGRKLVGSAQLRRRSAFLQHGSILLAGSQGITLEEVLRRPVTFEEVAAAIVSIWPSVIAPLAAR